MFYCLLEKFNLEVCKSSPITFLNISQKHSSQCQVAFHNISSLDDRGYSISMNPDQVEMDFLFSILSVNLYSDE